MQEQELKKASYKPVIDPLELEEVPQHVRDVINALYPAQMSEVSFKLLGIEELDCLFREASEPLNVISSVLTSITSARQYTLLALLSIPTHWTYFRH